MTTTPTTPLPDSDRIRSLDVLRGVAVLGIFVMNLRDFALPLKDANNPAFPEAPATAADLWSWGIANIFFEDKMIAIFSMLFGAGIVIMTRRVTRPALIHLRRMFWLLLIGLAHAYGLWYGDILNTYAIGGLVLFPFRRLPAPLLIGLGAVVLVVAVAVRAEAPMMETVSPPQQTEPAPESNESRIYRECMEAESAAYHGSWLELAKRRAKLNTAWHFYGGINFSFWRCGGFMLIGMGLVQLGVLSAQRPSSTYWGMLLGGYSIGLTLCLLGFWPQLARALGRPVAAPVKGSPAFGLIVGNVRYLGAAALAIGHIALVMLLCRARVLRIPLAPLAAAGRMALSNYLMQSVIAALIFDGWAGAQWSKWRFGDLTLLIGAVWLGQLVLSPIWLHFFHYGPMEWLWRSLTYWRPQPMRRRGAVA